MFFNLYNMSKHLHHHSSPVIGRVKTTTTTTAVNTSPIECNRRPALRLTTEEYALPLDIIISYLEDEDLRRFHQVSRSWKEALEIRGTHNERRLRLVESIRQNKENCSKEIVPARRVVRERCGGMDGKKNESCNMLRNCSNLVQPYVGTPSPMSNQHISTPYKTNVSTPTSHFAFQDFEEMAKSLPPGQKLVQCRRCRGPVLSPITNPDELKESRRLSRTNLTTRMIIQDGDNPENQERKKAKTLSAADLSPIPFSPPVTVASLGEQMTQSLVLSTPSLSMSSVAHLGLDHTTGTPSIDMRRSTSCSSITGIDLSNSIGMERSRINLSLNLSNLNTSSNELGISSLDFNDSSKLSWCRQKRWHDSQFSDSGLSCDSEGTTAEPFGSINFLPSPVPITPEFDSQFSCIERERGRFHDFSDRIYDSSSLSFQRSNPSFSNDSIVPILQCPNTSCRFKFCSNCEESEHPGRSCRVISSDCFELPADENMEISCASRHSSVNNPNSSSERSRDSNKKMKGKTKTQKSKTSLRRIARL